VFLDVQGGGRLPAGKVVGLVGNYEEHRREMGHAPRAEAEELQFFLKPTSALLPGGGRLLLPRGVGRVEHEVELAVVVGKRAQRVAPERAMEHVLGYAVMLDITARELQRKARERGLPWDEAKGFDTFAPIGTVMPRGLVPDPHALELRLDVNGQPRQRGSTAQMLVQVPQVLARVSSVMTLEPGDVIATGTPAGVGPVVPGDRLRAEAQGLAPLECVAVEA
jgi:2-keto-4-pentenoate hydratase/2-oxohepta-3-ene-1,7-dioic acid hydratase in catechol pathway